jgi:hypothetical protein
MMNPIPPTWIRRLLKSFPTTGTPFWTNCPCICNPIHLPDQPVHSNNFPIISSWARSDRLSKFLSRPVPPVDWSEVNDWTVVGCAGQCRYSCTTGYTSFPRAVLDPSFPRAVLDYPMRKICKYRVSLCFCRFCLWHGYSARVSIVRTCRSSGNGINCLVYSNEIYHQSKLSFFWNFLVPSLSLNVTSLEFCICTCPKLCHEWTSYEQLVITLSVCTSPLNVYQLCITDAPQAHVHHECHTSWVSVFLPRVFPFYFRTPSNNLECVISSFLGMSCELEPTVM